jgi:hypothetical protein
MLRGYSYTPQRTLRKAGNCCGLFVAHPTYLPVPLTPVPAHATKVRNSTHADSCSPLEVKAVREALLGDTPYPWQELVMLAMMEFDPQRLELKMNAALQAIAARRAELQHSAESREERIALEDAVNALKVAKQNRPGA